MVDRNFTESFNSWILEPRSKLILKMLKEIRVKIINRLRKKEKEVKTWPIHSKCMKLFIAYNNNSNLCNVDFNGDLGYDVSEGNVLAVEWHSMPPCHQGISIQKNIEPKDEISWWYTKEAYLKRYRTKLPMTAENFWQVLPEHAMDSPDLVKANEEGSNSCLKRKGARTEERQYEPYGPDRELESDPVLRPHTASKELTILEMRQTRKI
ncbi:hypothetical protein HAX54_030602 [Datura stramonium]|uniref:Uncharacterized protein n=1 Tax=Datura stramonium TaxID=4076 RepID=A0ABS8VA82_DATST|nr:hypothetical protein [Datura stramonium]